MTHKEYRVPVLTDNFQLKIISILKNNTDSEVLSTGEGQITSLAFIGSLVSYSKEKANSGMLSDFMGGDFPIVMDSPFENLDEVHTANVATNIGKLASQVIIIVSDKQWNKEVEENITNQVGKMYKMVDGNFGEENTGEYTILKEVAI
jgi:DNA sulfur modification protein DndD